MASVRKRTWRSGGESHTKWIVDYFDQDRKRHIETFETKREADTYRTNVLHEVQEGTHTAPHSSITVREAAQLWLDEAETNGLERSTLKQYELNVRHHINPLLGNLKLSSLSTPRIETFASDLKKRDCADGSGNKLSPAMARKVLGSLKAIIKCAQRKGKVAKNAALPVTIKVPKRGTVKIRAGRDFPTKEEINLILSKASGRWRPLIITAIFTGLRSSELRGLRWEDITFAKNSVIHVRQRADNWNKIGVPKTEAGERDIPMTPLVAKTLREWKLVCPRRDKGAKGDDDPGVLEYVFPNGDGKIESHANIANRGFYPLLIECGMVEDTGKKDDDGEPIMRARYGLHTLRHFFASWLLDEGFSLKKAQTLLGHATLAMTADCYGHLLPDLESDQTKFADAERALLKVKA